MGQIRCYFAAPSVQSARGAALVAGRRARAAYDLPIKMRSSIWGAGSVSNWRQRWNSSLPADYATVLRIYLEGWKPEEIATRLNLALQTVYNKRREAVLLLRKTMNSKD